MANRIHVNSKTKMPGPCPDLFRAMATAGYAHSVESMGREKSTPFLSLPGEVQDHWCGIARSMYAIVAIAGGATVGVVKDPQG